MASKRIAIIGAGTCGLAAIKMCLDETLEPICFETSNYIGGMWRYCENVKDGQARVSYTTVCNTCKEMMCFSDFPVPKQFPNFMHHTKVFEYLQLYASHFGLEKHIKFRHEVIEVRKSELFSVDGKWIICFKNLDTDEVTTDVFNAVMLCSGHHGGKHEPKFEGDDIFQGRIMHTQEYRDHQDFFNKKVVVIGLGNSGGDVSVDLSRVAKQVVLSTRRGAWVIPRTADNGVPVDYFATRRWLHNMLNMLPHNTKNSIVESKANARFDHAFYGLQPEHRADAEPPLLNEDLPSRILNGTVRLRPGVARFTETGVEFTDGSTENNVDVIILATGYVVDYPYLEKGIIQVVEDKVNLFKEVFPPDLQPATLAVIGLFRALGAINPPAELQCRMATRVFKGILDLPSIDLMNKDIQQKRKETAARFLPDKKKIRRTDFIPFMDELAEQVGCKPHLGRLFLKDPILAFRAFFGPCTPYQYRLEGPGKWCGAREAIMTQWERVCAPLETRQVPKRHTSSSRIKFVILVAAILVAVMIKVYGL